MQPRILLTAAAALAFFAGTAAAETPAPAAPKPDRPIMRMMHMDQAEMAQNMARMCADHYARAVGKLAYLETRLALTAEQKPLFDRWKDTLLAAAKAHSEACAAIKMSNTKPTLVERLKLQQKMLQAGLDTLKAQMPALEALNAALNEEQQRVLDDTARAMMHGDFMHHMGAMRMHRRILMRMNDADSDDNIALPPPTPATPAP